MLKVLSHPDEFFAQGSVVALGNFDGVHRGHQGLIEALKAQSLVQQRPAVIVLFEPQPKEFLSPQAAPPRLSSWFEKWMALKPLFPDTEGYLLTLHFDQNLAALSPEAFVHTILEEQLHTRCILVGEDFRFGAGRQGNLAFLKTAGEQQGFEVLTFPTQFWENHRISSTRIREALAIPDLTLAKNLLGRPYSLFGTVIKGDQRGRLLGFPTANLEINRLTPPLLGVFAVQVEVEGFDHLVQGIANLGTRPTVDGSKICLEVHLFDWHEEIYGKALRVEFISHIRHEQRFESLEALKAQITQDVQIAKEILS